jgi:hypothetical protein
MAIKRAARVGRSSLVTNTKGGAQGGGGRDWHRTAEREECFLGVVGGVGLECVRKWGMGATCARER